MSTKIFLIYLPSDKKYLLRVSFFSLPFYQSDEIREAEPLEVMSNKGIII